jgi:hypothetical protein
MKANIWQEEEIANRHQLQDTSLEESDSDLRSSL